MISGAVVNLAIKAKNKVKQSKTSENIVENSSNSNVSHNLQDIRKQVSAMFKQQLEDEKLGLPIEVSNLVDALESAANAIQSDKSLADSKIENKIIRAAKLIREKGFYKSLDYAAQKQLITFR